MSKKFLIIPIIVLIILAVIAVSISQSKDKDATPLSNLGYLLTPKEVSEIVGHNSSYNLVLWGEINNISSILGKINYTKMISLSNSSFEVLVNGSSTHNSIVIDGVFKTNSTLLADYILFYLSSKGFNYSTYGNLDYVYNDSLAVGYAKPFMFVIKLFYKNSTAVKKLLIAQYDKTMNNPESYVSPPSFIPRIGNISLWGFINYSAINISSYGYFVLYNSSTFVTINIYNSSSIANQFYSNLTINAKKYEFNITFYNFQFSNTVPIINGTYDNAEYLIANTTFYSSMLKTNLHALTLVGVYKNYIITISSESTSVNDLLKLLGNIISSV
ncbi:MAG: hypothetical protein QXN58_07010 [Saccharolobus sp.]